MTVDYRLDTLPSELIILIFEYCHGSDLLRLREVCTRFHDILREDGPWMKKSALPLVTNQASKRFRNRCNTLLCLRTKWHVSENWQYGRFEKKELFSQNTKLMPWMQLTSDTLWWSGGNQLCGFRRTRPFRQTNRFFNEENIRSDVTKFVVRDEYIISGHRDGSIKFWKISSWTRNHSYFTIENTNRDGINALDETRQRVISGSERGVLKIWNSPAELTRIVPSAIIRLRDRIWSLAADPLGTKCAVGTAGNNDARSLRIFDLECHNEVNIFKHDWRRGAGILDMVWENPQTLLTCGYDTYIRKWDLRSGSCVSSWPDPTDATLYCLSTDYQYTMISGTQFNCKAVLWDQRQKNFVQVYFLNLRRMSSPIYCITFDSSYLYGATDQHLIELTFSGHSYKENNYKEILSYL